MKGRLWVYSGAFLILLVLVLSYAGDGIVGHLIRPGLSATERVELVRTYFESWGAWAPLIYVFVVAIEVFVAPIPGLMLYAPGGLIFGGFLGGLLALIGNVLGAGIAAVSMQIFRGERLERFLERDKVEKIVHQLRDSGVWVILALRINPLTTTDLVSYAAGLAGIPVWKVMLGTTIGMAPLCWAQAYLAEELFESMPWLIYPLVLVAVVYVFVAVFLVRKALAKE